MIFFKTKEEKQLDSIIQRLDMNMSNNYKDNAQDNLKEFESTFEHMKSAKLLKAKAVEKYGMILEEYQTKLQGYTHKDQKPYWT